MAIAQASHPTGHAPSEGDAAIAPVARLDLHGADPQRRMLDACFLGPYAENDGLLEKLVVEFLRDHVYWRRNFHPEDPPAIPTHAAQHPEYLAFEARLRRELHQLLYHFLPVHHGTMPECNSLKMFKSFKIRWK